MIRQVKFKKGTVIFHEGDIADTLYVLKRGQIDIVKEDTKVEAINIPGSFFGEMSFLTGRIRTAQFVASTDVEAYEVGYRDKGKKFDVDMSLLIKLSRSMATRIDLMQERLTEQIPYKLFREKINAYAQNNKDEALKKIISEIEDEVNSIQILNRSALIKEALNITHIEQPFLESIQEILLFHMPPEAICKKDIEQETLLECIQKTNFYGSEIKFNGDAVGHIDLFLDESLAESFAKSFIGIDNPDKELTQSGVLELSNEILGRMANKISGVDIQLECPSAKKGGKSLIDHINSEKTQIYYFEHQGGHLIATSSLS